MEAPKKPSGVVQDEAWGRVALGDMGCWGGLSFSLVGMDGRFERSASMYYGTSMVVRMRLTTGRRKMPSTM